LEKSYWRRQRQVIISAIHADKKKLEDRLSVLILSEDEISAFEEKTELEYQITNSTNSKRRKAELALNRWRDEHSGSRWTFAETRSLESKQIKDKLAILEKDLIFAKNVSNDVEARIRVLEDAGFLIHLEDPKSHTKESLTTKGILATELNESDALLVSQLYLMKNYKNLEPKEVIALLAACITEGKKKEEEPSVSELMVPDTVKDALVTLSDIWCELTTIEKATGAHHTEWTLGTFWINLIWRWMEGDSVATLCSEYGIYEGNLIRSVLKVQSMLEEWRSMAGYCQHTDVLAKLENADSLLLREAVIQDSLYLHL